jgi:hypothetical protein
VEPAGETFGRREEIHVARDEPGIDEVVRLLNVRIVEPGLFEAGCVLQLVDVASCSPTPP